MEQLELFEKNTEVSRKRKPRVETNYRKNKSKDGFSPHIGNKLADRIDIYCKRHNTNKTKFVEACVAAQLSVLEMQDYESYSKEELIALLMEKEER